VNTRSHTESELPEAFRDPIQCARRGRYLLQLEKAGCHRLGENTECWRIRCNLGGECIYAEQAYAAFMSDEDRSPP
jgi:hypothetical protein